VNQLAKARELLNVPPPEPIAPESVEDFAYRVLGMEILRCAVRNVIASLRTKRQKIPLLGALVAIGVR
jgi:hypothetical protein